MSEPEYELLHYDSGNLKSRTPFVNGKKEGVMEVFFENHCSSTGQVHYQTPFVNDEIHGLEIFYTESGEVRMTTQYVKGKAEGKERQYDDEQQLRRLTHFKSDYKDGLEYHYDSLGNIESEWYFTQNDQICLRETGVLLVDRLTYLILTGRAFSKNN